MAVLLVVLLVAGARAGAEPLVDVPLDHWGYGVLERLEARGVLRGLGDGIKPFTRMEMARAVCEVARFAAPGGRLTRVERQELRLLEEEFAAELARLKGAPVDAAAAAGQRLRGGQPLLHYASPQGEMWADLLIRQQSDAFTGRGRDESERVLRNRVGGVVWGDFSGQLGYRISFEQTREQGTRRYYLRDDVYERRLELPQLKGGLADYHEGTAFLGFSLPFAEVGLGKGDVDWGPAPDDNLGLSNNAPSFDMVRLQTRYGAFKLMSLTGFLRPCPDRPDSPLCDDEGDPAASYVVNGMSRTLEQEKYLAAHRLEVALAPWLDLGFQEEVVYGDRGLQPAYLNPVMFYWAAQSYLGDKDNVLMGLDLDLHPGRGWRVYLAYAIDDLEKLRIFTNDFVNKFSLQAGLLWVDPLGWHDVDLRAEYVRIEPWMYTHKVPINTFRHFDAPLGHSLEPNSDRWRLGWGRRLGGGVAVAAELSRVRHGDNLLLPDGSIRNVGGDLHLGWRPQDGVRQTKRFLEGRREQWTQASGQLSLRVWNRFSAAAGYVFEWGRGVPLPPRWGNGVALQNRTGYGNGRQQHFSFELRYGYL